MTADWRDNIEDIRAAIPPEWEVRAYQPGNPFWAIDRLAAHIETLEQALRAYYALVDRLEKAEEALRAYDNLLAAWEGRTLTLGRKAVRQWRSIAQDALRENT